MKKLLFKISAALMLVATMVTGYNVYSPSQITDLISANIEALTRNEDSNRNNRIEAYRPDIISGLICCMKIDDLSTCSSFLDCEEYM